jgi:hypothetical protein
MGQRENPLPLSAVVDCGKVAAFVPEAFTDDCLPSETVIRRRVLKTLDEAIPFGASILYGYDLQLTDSNLEVEVELTRNGLVNFNPCFPNIMSASETSVNRNPRIGDRRQ